MNIDHALDGKVSPRTPLPNIHIVASALVKEFNLCSIHKTDISIKPCDDCLKLLDQLLKKYNILSDIEV